MPHTHAPSPACPRCGYDLRGDMATWSDQCPLDGRCTECGLGFRWRHVLDPDIHAPRWYIERRNGRLLPVQFLMTLWFGLIRPWWFWRQVRLEHRVDPWRLALFAFVFLVVLSDLVVGVAAACSFAALDLTYGVSVYGTDTGWATVTSALFILAAPFLTRPLPQAIAGPLGPLSGFAPWDFAGPHAAQVGTIAILAAVCAVAASLTFLALPVTRRRCKVRMVHVVRVGTIGLACWLPALLAPLLDPAGQLMAGLQLPLPIRVDAVVRLVPLLIPALLIIWWWSATRSYLRMPHAWAVALCVTAVGILCSLTIAAYVMSPLLR